MSAADRLHLTLGNAEQGISNTSKRIQGGRERGMGGWDGMEGEVETGQVCVGIRDI